MNETGEIVFDTLAWFGKIFLFMILSPIFLPLIIVEWCFEPFDPYRFMDFMEWFFIPPQH